MRLTAELPGRTLAYETSEVRPQVSGIIRARLFTEGQHVENGQTLYPIDARLYRAILMTSFAFIFGVLPLALSTGAGARSRIEIGTAVLGGMLTATLLAIFHVPMFFVLLRRIFRRRVHAEEPGVGSGSPSHAE